MMVSIALSQLYDPGRRCSSPFAGSELQTQHSYVGGRSHLSHLLPSPYQRLVQYKNYTAWWQRHVCVNNLPGVVTGSGTAGSQAQFCGH